MWVLQAIGAVMAYFSSWHTSAVIFIMVLVFVAHYFPISWTNQIKFMYRRRFPLKRRMLTQEEYEQQTAVETSKSLADLRKYVNSPECKQWAVMGKLRDPLRFASFANGAPHLDDEEIEDHSRTIEESMDAAPEEESVEEPEEDKPAELLPLPNSQFRYQQAARNSEPEPESESDDSEEEEFFEQEVDLRQVVQ